MVTGPRGVGSGRRRTKTRGGKVGSFYWKQVKGRVRPRRELSFSEGLWGLSGAGSGTGDEKIVDPEVKGAR